MATKVNPERRTQRERTETTTALLLASARKRFAAVGYAATSIDAIVAESGVSKGAFYHHYAGKRELFEAVFEMEAQRTAQEVWAAYERKRDPVGAAYAGVQAFFDAGLDPGYQQIALVDAPSVLGWARLREIESRYGLLLMKEAIRTAIRAGRLPEHDVDGLAHLLFGALCEGAMFIARAENQKAARRKIEREFRAILDALDLGR